MINTFSTLAIRWPHVLRAPCVQPPTIVIQKNWVFLVLGMRGSFGHGRLTLKWKSRCHGATMRKTFTFQANQERIFIAPLGVICSENCDIPPTTLAWKRTE